VRARVARGSGGSGGCLVESRVVAGPKTLLQLRVEDWTADREDVRDKRHGLDLPNKRTLGPGRSAATAVRVQDHARPR
jgi:hypothetical protein